MELRAEFRLGQLAGGMTVFSKNNRDLKSAGNQKRFVSKLRR
jgi:hypothetical protein